MEIASGTVCKLSNPPTMIKNNALFENYIWILVY